MAGSGTCYQTSDTACFRGLKSSQVIIFNNLCCGHMGSEFILRGILWNGRFGCRDSLCGLWLIESSLRAAQGRSIISGTYEFTQVQP